MASGRQGRSNGSGDAHGCWGFGGRGGSIADQGFGAADSTAHQIDSVGVKSGCPGSQCDWAGKVTACADRCRPTARVNVGLVRRNHSTIRCPPSSNWARVTVESFRANTFGDGLIVTQKSVPASGGHPRADPVSFDSQQIDLGVRSER